MRSCSATARRTSALVLPLVVGTALHAQSPEGPRDAIVDEIARLDSIWLNAYVTADAEAVRSILADDFVGQIHDTIMDKAGVLDRVRTASDVRAMALDRLVVNVYGDVAVAHAIRRQVTSAASGLRESRFAYTDVYQYREGRWRCITGQSAPIDDG